MINSILIISNTNKLLILVKLYTFVLIKWWVFLKIFFSSFNKGCIKPGVYGSNCDTPCPIHCKNNDCHIQNGMCFECNPGWKGATCQISTMIVLWWFSDTSWSEFFYIFFFLSVFLVVNYLNIFYQKWYFFSYE